MLETFDEHEMLSASPDAFPVPVVVTTADCNGTGRDRKNIKCNITEEMWIVRLYVYVRIVMRLINTRLQMEISIHLKLQMEINWNMIKLNT